MYDRQNSLYYDCNSTDGYESSSMHQRLDAMIPCDQHEDEDDHEERPLVPSGTSSAGLLEREGSSVSACSTTLRRPTRNRLHSDGELAIIISSDAVESGDESNAERSIRQSSPSTRFWCTEQRKRLVKQTMLFMNMLAKLLLWTSFLAMAAGIIWYSYELKNKGTEQHLIAWFSAGAFVILGFPISIYGIFSHLTHYYQPHVQCYVVRILWMVPIYSIESWLCLRFHEKAIYIETLRDCYEAYVLYSFLQFLINVLGGETELILLLKEKSPTRGVHMKPIHWCIKPWIMGQPLYEHGVVRWTSPFYVKCKFGVLQYVLLKYFCALITMILELHGLYKEGDFSPKSGYLYICIIINASQCWALYCLAFFYYATSNELAPIRPIGKFLSVKCLVFFTWWQSLGISILSYYDMIPTYQTAEFVYDEAEVAKIIQAYLICLEMFGSAIMHYFVFPHTEFSDNQNAALSGRPMRSARYHRLGRLRKQRAPIQTQQDTREQQALLKGESVSSELARVESTVEMTAIENPNTPAEHMSTEGAMDDDAVTLISHNSTNTDLSAQPNQQQQRGATGFVRALIDSTVPRDVIEDSHGIVKGDYIVQRKTLLHHATASDEYALFVPGSKGFVPRLHGFSPRDDQTTQRSHQRQLSRQHQVRDVTKKQMDRHKQRQIERWEGLNNSASAVSIPSNAVASTELETDNNS